MVPKPILALFFTSLGVWLPEVFWAAAQGVLAGWYDPKFGMYGGIAFAAVFGGMVAFPAGLVALLVYAVKEQASEALSDCARIFVPFATGIVLAPVKYWLETRGLPMPLPMWLPEIPALLALWVVASALASLLGLVIYSHAANPPLNTDAPPSGGAPVS